MALGEHRRHHAEGEAGKIAASSASPPSESIPRLAISAYGPQISFALRYGLVHALASAGIGNSTPGQVGPGGR
jgi:hypothetical protein